MEPPNNSLKWMTFSGLAEDYPSWSTRFSAFAQTKGLSETLTDTVELPDRHRLTLELQLYKKMRAAKTRFGTTLQ